MSSKLHTIQEWATDISIGLVILGFFGIMIYAPLVFS